ncbi:MAG: hypothetical protein AAGF24_15280, partial [Cyanobacteria bacterium P01_H01_bin.121]
MRIVGVLIGLFTLFGGVDELRASNERTQGIGAQPQASSPATVVQSSSPLLLQAGSLAPKQPSTLQLIVEVAIALSFLVASSAVVAAVGLFRQQQRWQKLSYIRKLVCEFETNPTLQNALRILDFENYRQMQVPAEGNLPAILFVPTDRLLRAALIPYDEVLQRQAALNQLKDKPSYPQALQQFRVEAALRDWFDAFLLALERFNEYIEAGLVTPKDLRPYLI